MNDTELRLAHWRDGSTQAERLAASILNLSGYENIDPQHPLGGPDGKKDIVCQKGGVAWIAAVYFPNSPVQFSKIKTKFKHDLSGTGKQFGGIAFITNQQMTQTQRQALSSIASGAGKQIDIFHLEKIRVILDSPTGFGTRIQFLRIPMSLDEQLSWAARSGDIMTTAISSNTRELVNIKSLIERMRDGQKDILRTIATSTGDVHAQPPAPDLLSMVSYTSDGRRSAAFSNLTVELILLIHRIVCFDYPSRFVGRLRSTNVFLQNADGVIAEHLQPPPPEEVSGLIDSLCVEWNRNFGLLSKANPRDCLHTIARFHAKLLAIHPFQDGNGRVARAILMQQCLDVYGRADMSLLDKGGRYYKALADADRDDYRSLVELLEPVIAS